MKNFCDLLCEDCEVEARISWVEKDGEDREITNCPMCGSKEVDVVDFGIYI